MATSDQNSNNQSNTSLTALPDASQLCDLPDRSHLPTEQRLNESAAIDDASIEDGLRIINHQDANIPAIVETAIPTIASLVATIVNGMNQAGRLIYLGAGTSGRLGVLDASECPPTFQSDPSQVVGLIAGGDSALRKSSEGKEDNWQGATKELEALNINSHDTVIGIAAGATTPYVLGGLKQAKLLQAATALIACIDQHVLSQVFEKLAKTSEQASFLETYKQHFDHCICLPVGPEVVTGSTRMKAGTATKLAVNMISTMTMIKLGKTWGNLMIDVRVTNAKLRDRAARILSQQCDLTRNQAFDLLTRAQGHVKTALVMHHKQVAYDDALTLLSENNQQLGVILGPPKD